MVQLSHAYMTTEKNQSFDSTHLCQQRDVLLFNMLSRLVIAFLPRSKYFNFMATVTIHSDFGAQENKICHCFPFFPFYLPLGNGTVCHELSFSSVEFQATFSISSFTIIKRLFSSFSLSAIRVVSPTNPRLWHFPWQSWFQLVIHPVWQFTWFTLHTS